MKRNLFIVLDGLDGSGKGEQIKKLHNYLFSKDKKYRILTTREPTSSRYGRKIRTMLKKEKDPLSNADEMLELYCKDREEHLKKTVEHFLSKKNGKHNVVLCDRYYYSTISFQSAQGIPIKKVISMNKGFRKPDLALILDLPAEVSLKRIGGRGKGKEKFEKLGFMRKLRMNFLSLPRILKDNIKIIDASKSIKKVFEQIKKEVDKLLA